jgi:hypothetical protein
VVLLTALLAYEVIVDLRFNTGWGPSVAVWALGAVAGGVVFGAAGWAWRHAGSPRSSVGLALLSALFLSEGLYLAIAVDNVAFGAILVAVGLVLPLILARSSRDRLVAYAAVVPCLGLAAAGYAVLLALLGP